MKKVIKMIMEIHTFFLVLGQDNGDRCIEI